MADVFKPCSVDGCNRNADQSAKGGRGWCRSHYDRWRRHGDPTAGRKTPGEAFCYLNEIVFAYEASDCLIWPYGKNTKGYASSWRDGKNVLVCRLICEHEHGPPPTPKHQVAHACGRGKLGCVNRKHLRWATHLENEADKKIHGTRPRGERHRSAKITEETVRFIRAMAGILSANDIARRFGISRTNVGMIQRRKTWRHVT